MSLSVRETYLPNLSTNIQTSSELEEPMNLKKQSVSDFGESALVCKQNWLLVKGQNFHILLILSVGVSSSNPYIITAA